MEHIDYLYSLSVAAVDKSEIGAKEKRDLIFGLYCFRCLFDEKELLSPCNETVKYKCCFFLPIGEYPFSKPDKANLTHGERLKEGGIVTEKNGEKFVKFDVGSPLWEALVKNGKLCGDAAAIPEKPSLYSMALRVVSLKNAGDELKAMWYIMFPTIIFIDAPYEAEIYSKLKEKLVCSAVFDAALKSRRSIMVYDSVEEMRAEGISPLAVDWYAPYIEYKNEETEEGITRETARFKRELALKNYAFVIAGTEKLLNTFPFDEELTLTNIAARVSSFDATENREAFLRETLIKIGEALGFCHKRHIYLLYYAGLCKLGLKEIGDAEADFKACLELDPNFELAAFMLKALRQPERWTGKRE